MQWTPQHLSDLNAMSLRSERGGHDHAAVDLLISNTSACMRAGRQIPDPTSFALPTNRFGQGYARADVKRLIDRLQRWRADWDAPAPPETNRRAAPSWNWTQSQVDWVRDRTFTIRRGGYVCADVDDFLDRVIVAMAHHNPLPDIASSKFDTSGFHQGYVFDEVDDFLDELSALKPGG